MGNQIFDAQLERIKLITGKRTQVELADFLGIRQSAISDACRRGKISSGWLVILLRVKNVHPEWILTGKGPCCITPSPEPSHYETGDDAVERGADEAALRRLPSRILADELVRRIAMSQENAFCSWLMTASRKAHSLCCRDHPHRAGGLAFQPFFHISDFPLFSISSFPRFRLCVVPRFQFSVFPFLNIFPFPFLRD